MAGIASDIAPTVPPIAPLPSAPFAAAFAPSIIGPRAPIARGIA